MVVVAMAVVLRSRETRTEPSVRLAKKAAILVQPEVLRSPQT
jgi:hypothetical protein